MSIKIRKKAFYLDGLILLNSGGLLLELLLIDHFEDAQQIIPLVFLSGVLAFSMIALLWPSINLVSIERMWLILTLISGFVGFFFHAYGNYEFAIEIYPNASNGQLLIKTIKGATPLLAPGAMIGLGLLGLIKYYILKTDK